MVSPSVVIRRKLENVRSTVASLVKQDGLSVEDQLNISNIYRMIAQIDERHRKSLKLSGHVVIPLHRRALAADCLSPSEQNALLARVGSNFDHDPAA